MRSYDKSNNLKFIMNILHCTLFNLNSPSAGLNRIYRLREALKKHKINLIVVGSGCSSGSWENRNKNGYTEILFNKEVFFSIRHSKSMRFAAEASKFYKKYLKDLIKDFNISGLIIYSPIGEVVGAITRQTKQKNIFVVADCGEYYRFSFHYLLNGMIFQQAFFKYFQMKNMSGVIAPSPIWYNRASKLNIPRVLLPGLSQANNFFRNTVSQKNKPINIVFMGRLTRREMPQVIFKSLTICKKLGLNFKFQLVGTKNEGYREKYWLRKLKNNTELIDTTKIYGFVSNEKRDQIQAQADIFIMLRPLDSESEHLFPSRIPEFMLSGNLTIISKVPPLDYYFEENCGVKFISSSNNPNELSKLIIELANNPLKRYEIGSSGRNQAIKNFSFEEMGFRLKSFLTDLNQ
jgi:glycosyltransferase involved in cell wall biosynthesis